MQARTGAGRVRAMIGWVLLAALLPLRLPAARRKLAPAA
jgi:hypothetical protein